MLRCLALALALATLTGCSTPSMMAWREIDQTFGPFGTVNHRHRAGPPVEEQRDVVLLPFEPAPEPPPERPPDAVIVVPGEPPREEPPVDEAPPEAAAPAEPVGPSLATQPLHLRCDARQRAEADERLPYVQPLSYWLFVPTFFGSAALFLPAVYGAAELADLVAGKDAVPRSWVMAGVVAPAGLLVMADVIGGALIAYGQPLTYLEPELAPPRWVNGRAGCAGIALHHAGRRYSVRADGSLDAWEEAYLAASLVAHPSPVVVTSDGVEALLPVSLDVRCALARDRGYEEPRGCPGAPVPTSAGARLPVEPWRPR